MIDEKKLLDVLCELGKSTQKHIKTAEKDPQQAMFEFALTNQLAMLHKAIEKVKEQPHIREWIACEDRMPEDGETVLATDRKYVYLVEYDADLDAAFGDIDGITDWQPLPDLHLGSS